MTTALKIKLLAGILAVLGVIAGLVVRGGRPIEVTKANQQLQHKLAQKVMPDAKHNRYVVP
jgi:hypothetical protein